MSFGRDNGEISGLGELEAININSHSWPGLELTLNPLMNPKSLAAYHSKNQSWVPFKL